MLLSVAWLLRDHLLPAKNKTTILKNNSIHKKRFSYLAKLSSHNCHFEFRDIMKVMYKAAKLATAKLTTDICQTESVC